MILKLVYNLFLKSVPKGGKESFKRLPKTSLILMNLLHLYSFERAFLSTDKIKFRVYELTDLGSMDMPDNDPPTTLKETCSNETECSWLHTYNH